MLHAVYSDIQVHEHLGGCKTLGLVNKTVTGPLWRVLESPDILILEMNHYFKTLLSCLEQWSVDASEVSSGSAVLYEEFPTSNDVIWQRLISPSDYDSTAQEILQIFFHAFSGLIIFQVESLPSTLPLR